MKTADNSLRNEASAHTGLVPEMDDRQFGEWVKLLERRTGMSLPPARRSFLETSLGLRMREIGFDDYRAYYEYLHSGGAGTVEWSVLVDRLTVHETRFFRHRPSLELVRDRYLAQRLGGARRPATLHAWSVACSTGEEAYTLAMILDSAAQAYGGELYWGVTGTDISPASLQVARDGVYHARKLRDLDAELRSRHFTDLDDLRVQVSRPLRQRMCFTQVNVLESGRARLGHMDIIYCQNLLIYFERLRRIEILEALVEQLAPGGLLVLGPGEAPGWVHPELERIDHPNTLAFSRRAAH